MSEQDMQADLLTEIQTWIRQGLDKNSRDGSNIFDYVIEQIRITCEVKAVTQVTAFKVRSTTSKGRYFEHLAVLLLPHIYPLQRICLWGDLPDDFKRQMGWGRGDQGIDAVIVEPEGMYSAVQFKYRTRNPSPKGRFRRNANTVTWKQLSTFYALCGQTNPAYLKRWIVMTNCEKVLRAGHKESGRDFTIAYQKLHNLPRETWEQTIPPRPGQVLGGPPAPAPALGPTPASTPAPPPASDLSMDRTKRPDAAAVREARLKALTKVK